MRAIAVPDAIRLSSPVTSRGEDWATLAEFTVPAGERVPFVLTWSLSHATEPDLVDAEAALKETTASGGIGLVRALVSMVPVVRRSNAHCSL